MEWDFAVKVTGPTKENPDGTDRQKIIKKCKAGEMLKLVREYDNPHDENAVAVLRLTDEQIGYLPRKAIDVAYHMDQGGRVNARVKNILSERTGLFKKVYSCVAEIGKGEISHKKKRFRAQNILSEAKSAEKVDPEKAISLYREAIVLMHEAQSLYDKTRIAAQVPESKLKRYPIDRLSLLLDKAERYEECLEEIGKYEEIAGKANLSDAAKERIQKRKERVVEKMRT